MNFEKVKAELLREIAQRRAVYPKWVKDKKYGWTREKATEAILLLEDALAAVEFAQAVALSGVALKGFDNRREDRMREASNLFANG